MKMGPPEVQAALNIDAATRDKLEVYVQLLIKWQKAINLISADTVGDIWRRHVLDCGQLYRSIVSTIGVPEDVEQRIADLGSGAGFPGLVLAILGMSNIDLVESDTRKATFLREAARILELRVGVHNCRAETLAPKQYALITARALAPLPALMRLSFPLLKTGGKLLILKGKSVDEELTQCEKQWNMTVSKQLSITDAGGVVLLIEDIEPIHA